MLDKAKKISCLVCDLDGVLTDGLLYIGPDGREIKTFSVQDGVGLKLVQVVNITVAVISGAKKTPLLETRMKHLGIRHYYCDKLSKLESYEHLKSQLSVTDEQCAYIGDDLPDLAVMQRVGFSIAVANAVPQVIAAADYHTQRLGGAGAVREVCDILLQAQDNMQQALTGYFHP